MTMSADGIPSSGQVDDTRAATASQDTERRAEQAAPQQASQNDTRAQQRPESLTREEYADATRASGTAIQGSREGHQIANGSEPRGQADIGVGRSVDRDPAEPADRDALGTGMRADLAERERAVPGTADPPTREEYADAMRRSGPAGRSDDDFGSRTPGHGTGHAPADNQTDAAASPVTHFHSEFKGRPIDLYTDGTRWGVAGQVSVENTVAGKADIPDQLPTGEELVDSAGEDSSRLERFRRELYKQSDDAMDAVEKDANLVHDAFSHPPTSSYQVTPVDRPYISEAQHSGIDAGSVATAAFVLGVVIDRGVRSVVQHYKEHAKGE
jgi:hypothetical protein